MVAGGWFVPREKYCWLVADKPSEQAYMSSSGVREFPESFNRLRSLLHLDLNKCYIEKGLAGALHGLTALQYLDMSHVKCARDFETEELPVAMRNLTNLKVLELENCICGPFVACTNLNFIGTLTNLQKLNLSGNWFEHLPESIGNLKRLHTLNLTCSSKLKSLPNSIGGATGLKSVLLDGCSQELVDQASSQLHYSMSLPLFKVQSDDVNGHSNLHLLEGENVRKLHIVSLENVRFVEEAERLNKLSTKHNLLILTLGWTARADRHPEDEDLLGQLVPPMSLKDMALEGYSSPSFPSWFMVISHHLPNLTSITLQNLPACTNLPPLGQLRYLERLHLWKLPNVTKIDCGICGGKGAYPRLTNFIVSFMDGLEEWNTTCSGEDGVEDSMFPVLDVLEISWCPRLRLVKPTLPKCREWRISGSDQVLSSLAEAETSKDRCNSTPATTSLSISTTSQHQSFRLFHHFPALQELTFT
jgi:hypothetical protein